MDFLLFFDVFSWLSFNSLTYSRGIGRRLKRRWAIKIVDSELYTERNIEYFNRQVSSYRMSIGYYIS